MDTLNYRQQVETAVIELARPEAMNPIDPGFANELREVCRDIAADATVRAVVLTGADTIFSAGGDLKDAAQRLKQPPAMLWQELRVMAEGFDALAKLPQPTIAAIAGYALGGGLELALACDLRVAAPSAVFGLPEAKVGLMPAAGGTQRLPRLIGAGRAAELLFTGAFIDAQRAYEIGLVNLVHESPVEAALEMAAKIASGSPVAIQLTKDVMWRGLDASLDSGLRMESTAVGLLFSTEDKHEGLAAFLEKRRPNWQGR